MKYKSTKTAYEMALIASILYSVIIYVFMGYSLDMSAHLSQIEFYEKKSDEFSIFDYVGRNNIIPYVYNNISWISPENIILFSYPLIGFIFSFLIFRRVDFFIGILILYANFVVILNTNRQVLAMAFFMYLTGTAVRKYGAAAFIHLSALFMPPIYLRLKWFWFAIPIFSIFIIALNFPEHIIYGYNENSSDIQGNYIPSLIALCMVLYGLNMRAYYIVFLMLVISSAIICMLLDLLLGFNQYIYLSRVVWILIMAAHVIYAIHPKQRISLYQLLIFSVSSIIFGSYHIYHNILIKEI